MAEQGPLPFFPYYFESALTKKQQNYYSTNGHSLLVKSLKVQIISELEECQELWSEFSPKLSLFDTWEFRLAFWNGYQFKPIFVVLKNDEENFALLPLWFDTDKRKKYYWFGSNWQEDNKFFVKDPLFIPLLLAICPAPVELNAISTNLPKWVKQVIRLKTDDPKYVLNLDRFNSVDDYLQNFRKKRRYNLKRDRRIIESQKPKIIFDRFTDYDNLVKLSIKRFTEKGEDTDWEDPRRVETFRQVIKWGQKKRSYQVRMLTVMIGREMAAVDLIALFNQCYFPLKCGYDVTSFPGIGNYVNLLEIEDALKLGMRKMDFLEIGYGWKDRWFEEVSLLKYVKR